MKIVFSFIIGVLVGMAVQWFFLSSSTREASSNVVDAVREEATEVSRQVRENIDTDRIRDELARTGRFVREKAREAGSAIADVAADAKITAAVKSKLIAEPGLDALSVDVDTSGGVVTLSGTLDSHDEIARAMELALQSDGVTKVISAVQVK